MRRAGTQLKGEDVKKLIIVLSFVLLSIPSVQAQESSTEKLKLSSQERMLHRRAVDAVIWSMPLVNFQAMRDGLKKDAGVGFNDVAYH
jgi:hypothetical protein